MTTLSKISRFDWGTWLVGIMRSFISGGGGALAGFFGPALTDSKDFNFGAGLGHTIASMAVGFFVMGLVQMGIFLKTHGAPDPVTPAAPGAK